MQQVVIMPEGYYSQMPRVCFCALVLHVHLAGSQTFGGVIQSPNYPQTYDRNDDWPAQQIVLSKDEGDYLILWLDDIDLPPPDTQSSAFSTPRPGTAESSTCTEYIRIFEVDSQETETDIAILCGSIDQYDPKSRHFISLHGNVVNVVMHFDSVKAEKRTGRGYRLLYSAGFLSCANDVFFPNQAVGIVASPQFPENKCLATEYTVVYNENLPRFWIVSMLYFSSSKTCSTSKVNLHVQRGSAVTFCGGHISEFRQTTFITVQHNNQLGLSTGAESNFLIKHNITNDYGIAWRFSNKWPRIELNYDVMKEGITCEWRLQSPIRTVIFVQPSTIQLFKPSSDYCRYRGLYFTSGPHLLFYHCPDTNFMDTASEIIATSNLMQIQLVNVSQNAGLSLSLNVGYYGKLNDPPTVESNCTLPSSLVVSLLNPVMGIAAGGTRLTLSGLDFPARNVLLTYGEYEAASQEPCSDTTCYAITPPGQLQDVDISFPVSVKFLGQLSPISTQFTFTYKPNPKVSSIHPLETLAAGGTTLTIGGEGFDAVNDPELIIRMLHTNSGTTNETVTMSPCAIASSNTLKCPTPALDIPEHFKKSIDAQSRNDDNEAGDFVYDVDGESLKFKLGVGLDGDQKYRDLSEPLPEYSQIKVFLQEPEFERFTQTREVSGGERLGISGKRLTDGLEMTDYAVRLSTGSCRVVDVTDNQLLCEVPEEESLEEADEHAVLVYPGTNISPHDIGSIQYRSAQITMWIIIGVCVGVVLIAIVIVVIVCFKRRVNNRQTLQEQPRQAVQMQPQQLRQNGPQQQQQGQPRQGNQEQGLRAPRELGYLNDNMAPDLRQTPGHGQANGQYLTLIG